MIGVSRGRFREQQQGRQSVTPSSKDCHGSHANTASHTYTGCSSLPFTFITGQRSTQTCLGRLLASSLFLCVTAIQLSVDSGQSVQTSTVTSFLPLVQAHRVEVPAYNLIEAFFPR